MIDLGMAGFVGSDIRSQHVSGRYRQHGCNHETSYVTADLRFIRASLSARELLTPEVLPNIDRVGEHERSR
jgi:hypothetical protein